MEEYELKVVFDLGGEVAEQDETLRAALTEELRKAQKQEHWYDRSFNYAGQKFKYEAGLLVSSTFGRYNSGIDLWKAYDGLSTRYVRISEEGSDNFPETGFYRSEDGQVQATVKYRLSAKFPMDEESIIRPLLETGSSDYVHDKTLALPVLQQRYWHLTLSAQSLETAHSHYQQLRTGTWKPVLPLYDALSDPQKVAVVAQRRESGES